MPVMMAEKGPLHASMAQHLKAAYKNLGGQDYLSPIVYTPAFNNNMQWTKLTNRDNKYGRCELNEGKCLQYEIVGNVGGNAAAKQGPWHVLK